MGAERGGRTRQGHQTVQGIFLCSLPDQRQRVRVGSAGGGGGYQYEKGKERGERQRKVERGDCISLKKDKNKQTNFSFKLFFCSPFEGQ
jgi:ribosomal protein S6E (S10)